jgi:hypothetical protein
MQLLLVTFCHEKMATCMPIRRETSFAQELNGHEKNLATRLISCVHVNYPQFSKVSMNFGRALFIRTHMLKFKKERKTYRQIEANLATREKEVFHLSYA